MAGVCLVYGLKRITHALALATHDDARRFCFVLTPNDKGIAKVIDKNLLIGSWINIGD